jgi:alcohol dehydrogenase, propanol-preferring
MRRSDCQLMEGYFTQGAPSTAPITPGHEVAGRIAEALARGDVVGRAVLVLD